MLQNVCYNIHKTDGIVIFLLAVVRLGWRWSYPVPLLPADMPGWQAKLAHGTHALLDILLFLMPVTGFVYTALAGFPVPFFMLVNLAQWVPVDKPVAEGFQTGAPQPAVRVRPHGRPASGRRAATSL